MTFAKHLSLNWVSQDPTVPRYHDRLGVPLRDGSHPDGIFGTSLKVIFEHAVFVSIIKYLQHPNERGRKVLVCKE